MVSTFGQHQPANSGFKCEGKSPCVCLAEGNCISLKFYFLVALEILKTAFLPPPHPILLVNLKTEQFHIVEMDRLSLYLAELSSYNHIFPLFYLLMVQS